MIREIVLRNFKCFPSVSLPFANLNILAGANGTGKSSVIQALLVLFQSAQSGSIGRNRLQLNGPLIDLGTGRDVLYRLSEADQFEIDIASDKASLSILAKVQSSKIDHVLDIVIQEASKDPNLAMPTKLLYLCADRLGPQKGYPMSMEDVSGNEIGRRGEYAPLTYFLHREDAVQNSKLLLENDDKRTFATLETQFTLWMRRLFPGFSAMTEQVAALDAVTLGLALQGQYGAADHLRPTNVGFGVSVVFPVILCGLLADSSTTLVVENPEAHLHPSAQSLVGEFLARVASGGTQVFVETHSDHVINGIRLAHKNAVLSTKDLQFFAFARTDKFGSQRVDIVPLSENSEFKIHPDSFFDQYDKDLKLIYGI